MRSHLLAATALGLLMNAAPVLAQGTQDTPSQSPVGAQGRPPEPAGPLPDGQQPQDQTDYQTPAEPGQATGASPTAQTPGVPATPPGAPETPSTSPATSAGVVEPSAGGAMLPLEKYLTENGDDRLGTLGDRRRQLIKKPVVMPSGETAGTINQFVIRDGRNYAHLTLPKTSEDRERDVVAPLEMLSVSPDGERVVIEAQSRDELKKLPQFMSDSFQTVR